MHLTTCQTPTLNIIWPSRNVMTWLRILRLIFDFAARGRFTSSRSNQSSSFQWRGKQDSCFYSAAVSFCGHFVFQPMPSIVTWKNCRKHCEYTLIVFFFLTAAPIHLKLNCLWAPFVSRDGGNTHFKREDNMRMDDPAGIKTLVVFVPFKRSLEHPSTRIPEWLLGMLMCLPWLRYIRLPNLGQKRNMG